MGIAKARIEDGHPLMAGTIIIDPDGFVVARAETEGDNLVVRTCDVDALSRSSAGTW